MFGVVLHKLFTVGWFQYLYKKFLKMLKLRAAYLEICQPNMIFMTGHEGCSIQQLILSH